MEIDNGQLSLVNYQFLIFNFLKNVRIYKMFL